MLPLLGSSKSTVRGLMHLKRQKFDISDQKRQELDIGLTFRTSGNLQIPQRSLNGLISSVAFVVLMIHLLPNIAAKLNFNSSIEWSISNSTESRK